MRRFLRHLFSGKFLIRKYFPEKSISNIEAVIREMEKRHNAELVLAIEASLPLNLLCQKVSARDRAIDLFSFLRVWDTEENSGVLFYLLLASESLEIVADRGVAGYISTTEWIRILEILKSEFRKGYFEKGVILALTEISELLSKIYPPKENKTNQIPDKPIIIM